MKNWKIPSNDNNISKYVECYWYLEKEADDHSNNYPKLNPDPSTHLIIANSQYTSDYTYGSDTQQVQGSHWIFPHLHTFTMNHTAPFQIIGIKFKVGALYSLNLPSPEAMTNNIESMEKHPLIGVETFKLQQLLNDAFEKKEQVANALDVILSNTLAAPLEDKHSDLVRQVLPLLCQTQIANIGEHIHRSQRTVERSFLRVTGFTMKQIHSMKRLEEILNDLYQQSPHTINWADLANKYHFSDQPHLIRHLKRSIGHTPSGYEQQRDLTIDIYGDFELD